jgi:hypothetical protein
MTIDLKDGFIERIQKWNVEGIANLAFHFLRHNMFNFSFVSLINYVGDYVICRFVVLAI